MRKFRIEIVNSINDKLARDWQTLWQDAKNANPFNSYGWFLTCVNTFDIKNYNIYLCYKDGELVLVFPTLVLRKFGIKVVTGIANKHNAKTPLLIKNCDAILIKALIDKIISRQNLYLVQMDEKLSSVIKRLYSNSLVSLISLNQYVDLSDDPLRFLSNSIKNRIQNKIKKNQEFIRFKNVAGKKSRDYLDTIFSVEQKSAKKEKSKDIFSKEENRKLYQNTMRYLSDLVQINFLYYGSIPMVYSFEFVYKGTCLGVQTAYLAEYRSLSPGKLLMYFMLRDLYSRGMKIFDFGMGHNSFKEQFAPEFKIHCDIYYSKNRFVRYWWEFINFLRRIKALATRTTHSKDGNFLFKKFNPSSQFNVDKGPFYI